LLVRSRMKIVVAGGVVRPQSYELVGPLGGALLREVTLDIVLLGVDALDPELGAYLRFHLDVIECPFCQANLADLQAKSSQPAAAVKNRHNRILKSSQHLLGDEGRG